MIRLYVRHPVTDFSKWKQAYDSFDQERREMGVSGDAVFQSLDNPNDVTVCHDFETKESARTFADSPRLRTVMKEGGVSGEPSIWFTTQV